MLFETVELSTCELFTVEFVMLLSEMDSATRYDVKCVTLNTYLPLEVFWKSSVQMVLGQSANAPLSLNLTCGRGSENVSVRKVITADLLNSGANVELRKTLLFVTLRKSDRCLVAWKIVCLNETVTNEVFSIVRPGPNELPFILTLSVSIMYTESFVAVDDTFTKT